MKIELSNWFPGSSPFDENTASGFPDARDSWDDFDFKLSLFWNDQLEYVVHLHVSSASFLLLVSLKLLVFEKNQNFLLVHVQTAVRPAFVVILHLQDPSLQCFQLNRNRSVCSVIGLR